jgi:hypothetical protein
MSTAAKTALRLLIISQLGLLLAFPLFAQQVRMRVLAATGTAAEVDTALRNGADFNDRDWSGATALMAAAGNNHNGNVVAVLLRYGAVVDARDKNGETALMFAAKFNPSLEVAIALLRDAQVLPVIQEAMKGSHESAQSSQQKG